MVARGVLDCASIAKMMHHDDRICVVVRRCIGHDCTMVAIAERRVLNILDSCCPLMGVGVHRNAFLLCLFWPCSFIGRGFFVLLSLKCVNQGDGPTGHWGGMP